MNWFFCYFFFSHSRLEFFRFWRDVWGLSKNTSSKRIDTSGPRHFQNTEPCLGQHTDRPDPDRASSPLYKRGRCSQLLWTTDKVAMSDSSLMQMISTLAKINGSDLLRPNSSGRRLRGSAASKLILKNNVNNLEPKLIRDLWVGHESVWCRGLFISGLLLLCLRDAMLNRRLGFTLNLNVVN